MTSASALLGSVTLASAWARTDILGLFEYLPTSLAVGLVRNAVAACRPGGIVIVANMLDTRSKAPLWTGSCSPLAEFRVDQLRHRDLLIALRKRSISDDFDKAWSVLALRPSADRTRTGTRGEGLPAWA